MPEPQVRSYHRAFSGELLIHSLGSGSNSLRPYRPIPVRTVCWTAAWVAVVWILVHVTHWHLPMMTLGWGFLYLAVPLLLGWVFAAGEVEGRRLHVIAPVWVRHVLTPRRLIGGWRPPPSGPACLRAKRVRVWR